jgi:hypothetical protein
MTDKYRKDNGELSQSENMITDEQIVQDVDDLYSYIKDLDSKLSNQINNLNKKLEILDSKIAYLSEEIDKLELKKKEYIAKKEFSKADRIDGIILHRIRILKHLFESRADTEQTLQAYYKLKIDARSKASEIKLKTWERFKKNKSDDDADKVIIKKVINEMVKKALSSQQNETDSVLLMENASQPSSKNSKKKKREELLNEDEDILPNEFRI